MVKIYFGIPVHIYLDNVYKIIGVLGYVMVHHSNMDFFMIHLWEISKSHNLIIKKYKIK
jgi:hypothetical protein